MRLPFQIAPSIARLRTARRFRYNRAFVESGTRNMFESLSERLTQTLRTVAGRARLSDENITEALRDVRTALYARSVRKSRKA
jgi:hypothetical protein